MLEGPDEDTLWDDAFVTSKTGDGILDLVPCREELACTCECFSIGGRGVEVLDRRGLATSSMYGAFDDVLRMPTTLIWGLYCTT